MGNEIDSFKFTQLELKSNPIACKLIPPDFKGKSKKEVVKRGKVETEVAGVGESE